MKATLRKLEKGEHVTIVALGDSITQITFHTEGRMNWVGLLSEALTAHYGPNSCTMINSGRCGGTYEQALERLDRDVLRFNPELVILAFGMNDSRGDDYFEQFKACVHETIDRIQRECGSEILIRTPNPIVVCNGLPLPPEQPRPGGTWETALRQPRRYAQALVDIAAQKDLVCVDHFTLWSEATFSVPTAGASTDPNGLWPRMSDGIHPGYAGHLAFFRELAPYFEVSRYFPWEIVEPSDAGDVSSHA